MKTASRPSGLRVRLAALLLCGAGPLAAQASDHGLLVIRQQGREVGQEVFVRRWGPPGTPESLSTTASYPRTRPAVELIAALRRPGLREATFQLERRQPGAAVFHYAVLSGHRVTVRRVERGGEQAAEYPAPGPVVLLADSVLALYAQIVSLAGRGDLVAIFPATGQRVGFAAECGPSSRDPGGAGGQVCRLSGGLSGEVEVGPDGRLLRVSLPARGVEGLRKD
jgi:hypothetical protein